ncbi:MAG: hypothetical protein ACE14T_07005 [Syntrophales bacterium]
MYHPYRKVCLLIVLIFLLAPAAGRPAVNESQDIIKFGSDLMIEEDMDVRDAVTIGGDITVDGPVQRDVTAIGGSVYLTNKAIVGRNVLSIGGTIEKSEGAMVQGSMKELSIPGTRALMETLGGGWAGSFPLFGLWSILSFLGFVALALLITAFFPGITASVSLKVETAPVQSALSGLAGILLIVPVGILLVISLIGIVLIPVEAVLVSIGFLLGYVGSARLIGRKFASSLKKRQISTAWETLWGVVVLGLIGFIPALGWIMNALAVLIGFGGVLSLTMAYFFPRRWGTPQPGAPSANPIS